MGDPNTTVAQMAAYYKANATYPAFYADTDAPTIEDFCQIYYEECKAEGVRVDVAFCQAMKETGFLKYGGQVSIEQFNFAGLGATDGGAQGASFASVRIGVRAQVQHLKAYASKDKLVNACVDERFSLVTRNSAPYVEWLGIQENPYGKGWASGKGYGYSIINDYMANLRKY
ncbi:MAG: glucosaminidase domain-containing protein [Lachnospiraceae bacterium]|nr:glucosaminidase domain-containing protein [Lachnospiraceae bacterium]